MLGQDSMLERHEVAKTELKAVIREESEKTRGKIKTISSKLDRTNDLLENRFQRLKDEIEKSRKRETSFQ